AIGGHMMFFVSMQSGETADDAISTAALILVVLVVMAAGYYVIKPEKPQKEEQTERPLNWRPLWSFLRTSGPAAAARLFDLNQEEEGSNSGYCAWPHPADAERTGSHDDRNPAQKNHVNRRRRLGPRLCSFGNVVAGYRGQGVHTGIRVPCVSVYGRQHRGSVRDHQSLL